MTRTEYIDLADSMPLEPTSRDDYTFITIKIPKQTLIDLEETIEQKRHTTDNPRTFAFKWRVCATALNLFLQITKVADGLQKDYRGEKRITIVIPEGWE